MYSAIREIHEEFDKRGFKHDVLEMDNSWIIKTGVNGDKASYDYLFIKNDEEDNDVALRVVTFASFPKDRINQAYKLVGELNNQYRFFRFVVDSDGDLHAEYDFPISCSNIGPAALEMLVRATDILDNAYPKVMRAIWA